MSKSLLRLFSALLIAGLVADAPLAAALQRSSAAQFAWQSPIQDLSGFNAQALAAVPLLDGPWRRVLLHVPNPVHLLERLVRQGGDETAKPDPARTIGLRGGSRVRTPLHPERGPFHDGIGADTGGDLALLSNLLRQAKALYRLHHGAAETKRQYLSTIVNSVVNQLAGQPTAKDASLILDARAQAMKLLGPDRRPAPNLSIRIVLIDLPQDVHGVRFAQRILNPETGVKAINFAAEADIRTGTANWTIVVRRQDLTPERLAHDLREIALREQGWHWILAHNQVVAEGLGGGKLAVTPLPLLNKNLLPKVAIASAVNPTLADQIEKILSVNGAGFNVSLEMELNDAIYSEAETEFQSYSALVGLMATSLRAEVVRDPDAEEERNAYVQEIFLRNREDHDFISARDLMRDISTPILTKYGVPADLHPVIISALIKLAIQRRAMMAILGGGEQQPIGNIVSDLKEVGLTRSQAVWAATLFARALGMTFEKIERALQEASLASSQNMIGAAVGRSDKNEDNARLASKFNKSGRTDGLRSPNRDTRGAA